MFDHFGTTQLSKLANDKGIAVHIDGARLFNAAIASGKTLSELAAHGSSVSVSLNKSLGAPFGANKFRIVTHRGIDDQAVKYATTNIRKVLTELHRS